MSAIVSRLRQKRETGKAIQFAQLDRDGKEGAVFWVPASMIEHTSKMGDTIEITIPAWIADQRELDYYENEK